MTSSKLLVVDDEENNRNSIIRLFDETDGLEFVEACNGRQALEKVDGEDFDLILLDIRMPELDGFGFLERFANMNIKNRPPICVMTAFNDAVTRRKSISLGATDFINKPMDPVELETRIAALLRTNQYQKDLNNFNDHLEKLVEERTRDLEMVCMQLKETERNNTRSYREMIARIARLANYSHSEKEPETQRLAFCTAALGWMYGMAGIDAENLALSAQVYAIGKLALPEQLRETPEEMLDADLRAAFNNYPLLGSELFKNADTPLLRQAYNICLYHKEHFDGSGYPGHYKGGEIPLEARLFTTAYLIMDTMANFDNFCFDTVANALRDHAGTLLDPAIVDRILAHREDFEEFVRSLKSS